VIGNAAGGERATTPLPYISISEIEKEASDFRAIGRGLRLAAGNGSNGDNQMEQKWYVLRWDLFGKQKSIPSAVEAESMAGCRILLLEFFDSDNERCRNSKVLTKNKLI
jgi:hypothetical protein